MQDIDQSFKEGHEYSFHASNASGQVPLKSTKSTCTRFLVGTTISECARRCPHPATESTAKRAGSCKAGIMRNLADTHLRLGQPLTRYGEPGLIHEL
jgi:hypothetical protein